MSKIFNKKEDVLSVELTKHGRKLLGMGIFQPKYFSFFDDTVIYDSNYGGISEETNHIQSRILDLDLTYHSFNLLQDTLDEDRLGTSDIFSDNAPAWSIVALNGKLSYDLENSSYYKKIFDIDPIQYNLSLEKNTDEIIPNIQGQYILLDIRELNLMEDINNFEVEIVTFDDISGGKDKKLERRLYFNKKNTNIIDDVIYDEEELPSKFNDVQFSKEDVGYYLDILVDDEIDTEYIVSTQKTIEDKIKGTYSSDYTGPVKDPC